MLLDFPRPYLVSLKKKMNIRNNRWNQPDFINTDDLAFQVDLGIKGNKQIRVMVTIARSSITASVLLNLQTLSSKPSTSRISPPFFSFFIVTYMTILTSAS